MIIRYSFGMLKKHIINILIGHSDTVRSLVYIDNDTLASGSDDRLIILWNQQGNMTKILKGHRLPVTSFGLFKNGDLVSCANFEGIIIWQSKSWIKKRVLYKSDITSIAVLPNDFLVYGSSKGAIVISNINKCDSNQYCEQSSQECRKLF